MNWHDPEVFSAVAGGLTYLPTTGASAAGVTPTGGGTGGGGGGSTGSEGGNGVNWGDEGDGRRGMLRQACGNCGYTVDDGTGVVRYCLLERQYCRKHKRAQRTVTGWVDNFEEEVRGRRIQAREERERSERALGRRVEIVVEKWKRIWRRGRE